MKERESQFELLRIIAMAMVVTVHFNGVAIEKFLPVTLCRFADVWGAEVLESAAIIGVNLFVLISGYFGIRLSAKGIAKFVGWVLWYSIGLYFICCCFYPELVSAKYAEYAFMGISHSSQWFITSYFVLMAVSPAINAVLQRTTYRQHLLIAAVLVAVNCGLGWWMEIPFNETGYTAYHMVFVYVLGHVLREVLQRHERLPWRGIGIAGYVASVLALVAMMQSGSYFKVIAYNNPVVLIESLAFFVIFATMRFSCRWVNWVASSSFAVYLIHMHFGVYPHALRPLLSWVYDTQGADVYALWAALIGVVMYMACIIVDKPRAWLFNRLLSAGKTKAG